MKTLLLCLLTAFAVSSSFAQQRKFINPEGLNKPNGYTHVVVSGGTVYISGQVGVDANGQGVGKGDLRAQATKVYENLKVCLAAAGIAFSDVIKMNTYVVNLKPEDVTVIREIRKTYLPADNPPASTMVGVSSLVNPDWLIEIEVVARTKQ